MKSTNLAVACLAALALTGFASANSFTGPTSTFYLDVGINDKIYMIQGTTATFVPWAYDPGSGAAGEAILAVSNADGISTAPNAQTIFGGTGGLYSLAGVATGSSNLASPVEAYDATSNGTYNFYVGPGGSDDVYESNLDWSDPTVLFSTSSVGLFWGIAYDPVNNSLWVSQQSQSHTIADFSLTGTLLSSFVYNTTLVPHVEAFGFDPADDTLWGEVSETGELAQWNTSGTLLQEGTPSGLPSGNYLSGDFEEGAQPPTGTPEPATLLLTGSGLLMFVRRLRKK